ncbi:ubiquitin domain-containing protein 1-like, partial [Trifolium pratense]
GTVKKIRKPKPWKHPQPITKTQLIQLRDEFWDTAPHYGGRKEIWDALRAAAEADLSLAQAIVDSAGVIVQSSDLTVCYDERDMMEWLYHVTSSFIVDYGGGVHNTLHFCRKLGSPRWIRILCSRREVTAL